MSDDWEWRAALRCDECLATYTLGRANLTVEEASDAQVTSETCDQDDCEGSLVVEKNQHRVSA